MKKFLSFVLVLCFALTALVACKPDDPTVDPSQTSGAVTDEVVPADEPGMYTYKDSVVTLATNWNPHTYQTTDDSYPASFIRSGLYTFIFNDASHPIDGKDAFAGYKIVPEMAAAEPVDVTEAVKATGKFNIPKDATKGYAYTIKLNPEAKWENGTPINADTYVYSMQKLLDPKLLNYRATDYYAGDLCIAGAEFYANQGQTKQTTADTVIKNEGLADLAAYIEKHANDKAFINWNYSYGEQYDPATKTWGAPKADAVVDSGLTVKELYDIHVAKIASWGYDKAVADEYYGAETYIDWTYPSNVSYDTVGCYKSGDYEITLVFGKSLAGFNLFYNLSGNWIVYEPYYEANLKEDKKEDGTSVWSSTYNTTVESTMSYGPYKLTFYQASKSMKFEKNMTWFGYYDDAHKYVSPIDGKKYTMYQTDVIDCQVVAEASTRKQMFLKGELMGYGLQAEDFDQYRDSDYTYATPSETIFFLIVNGYLEALQNREKNEGFDKAKNDLETLSLKSFKKALAVTFDKDLFASTISPARSGGFGIIGTAYVYDPETGARYRDTDQAKRALLTFYGVDETKFASLDEAVDSITGYDPTLAKQLFKEAYDESVKNGYITDTNNDGKCDQVINIEYCASDVTDFITKTINYLNEKLADVIKDTPFEGKINLVASAPYGNEWSNKIKQGLSDTVLGGWSGSALNPFSLTDLYVNPSYAYDANWFNADDVSMKLKVNTAGIGNPAKVEELEMTITQWSDALNGATVEINGKGYCFGDGIADIDTRLDILAAFETKILETYDYIPMLQDGSMAMLTKQCYYVVEEYNPVMGRGGIAYLRYNYDDTAWAQYVTDQGGVLEY